MVDWFIYYSIFIGILIPVRLLMDHLILSRQKRLGENIQADKGIEQKNLEKGVIKLEPEILHLWVYESSTIHFLDTLCERPFSLIFQNGLIRKFMERVKKLGIIRNHIQENWVINHIEEKIIKIIENAENIAKKNGFYHSKGSQFTKYFFLFFGPYLILFTISFVLTILFIKTLLFWVCIGFFLGFCVVTQSVSYYLSKRWQKLTAEKGAMVNDSIIKETEYLRTFIQFLIDDLCKVFLDNNIDTEHYRLVLYSPNYNNLKIWKKWKEFYILQLLP